MSGHTPGPWVAEGGSVSAHHAAGDSRLEYWICEEVNGDRRCNAKTGTPMANARLIAAAPDLLEALIVVEQCGDPVKVSLYDEEGIEGWRWSHPDGREWEEIGDWSDPPPLHPLSQAAIAKATGAAP